MKKLLILVIVIIVLIASFFVFRWYQAQNEEPEPQIVGEAIGTDFLITLDDRGSSDLTGKAVVSEVSGEVIVDLTLNGPNPITETYLVAFQEGTCTDLGEVVFPLNDAMNGSSVTTLANDMRAFKEALPLVLIVVEQSSEEAVACGYLDAA